MAKVNKKEKKQKKLDYFEAFSQQIEIATKEAELLIEITDNFTTAQDLEKYLPRAHEIENEGDAICHKVYDAILPDFVTPIDREDILSLTNSLDEVTNMIEEVIQSFYMYDIRFMHDDAKKFAAITHKCCKHLQDALAEFDNFKKAHKSIQNHLRKVDDLEDSADELFMNCMHTMYSEESNHSVRVMVWTHIFATMEDCVDACEDIAELMNCIILKHG